MASIDASTAGVGGVITTSDNSGNLNIQSGGSTKIAVTSAGVAVTGTLSASGGVTASTPIGVASGGTGAATLTSGSVLVGAGTSAISSVAPGTSGNVLTSNGTTWSSTALPAGGVTSLNGQTGAITNTSLYAIGGYVNGRPANTTLYAVDSTIAGTSLYQLGGGNRYQSGAFLFPTQASLVNTGTWRCVSQTGNDSNVIYYPGLWVRIS